jgi:low temperature requirement protein LtrA
MPILSATKNYLRPRGGRGTAPVTQIELFFDLVFVFAITQLSATLRTHLTLPGLGHSLILFAAVWWVWVYTSWITNWLDPSYQPVRAMLIALMLLGLILACALPKAFEGRGLPFAAAYAAMQLGRSLFMLWAVRQHDSSNFRNFQRITTWLATSSLLWLAGAFFPGHERVLFWLIALTLDIIGPGMGFRTPGLGISNAADWAIDSDHIAERCAGFILIALGESLTVTGETFYTLHWTLDIVLGVLAAFFGIIALWWIYFDKAAERTADAFAEAKDPGRIARAAYTYVHGLLVAGIIAIAAGNEVLLDHPLAHASLPAVAMLVGGPIIFLGGNGIFRRLLHPKFPRSHIFGIAILILLAAASPFIPLLALAWAVTFALASVSVCSDFLLNRQAQTQMKTQ